MRAPRRHVTRAHPRPRGDARGGHRCSSRARDIRFAAPPAAPPRSLLRLAPHLDRHLADVERERGLRLGRLDPDDPRAVALDEPVGDRGTETLERLVRPLLGDEVRGVTYLAVVDRVLDAVGDGGVTVEHLEAEVEEQARARLPLRWRHADAGEPA